MRKTVTMLLTVLLWTVIAHADTFQGFETGTGDWTGVDQVASGTHGITSKTGNFHAEAPQGFYPDGSGYVLWNVGDALVPPGFTSSVDIYLDLNSGASNDTRFDWDVALQTNGGSFVRDFVFNGGYYDETDATGNTPRFVISAGNNAGRPNAYPADPNHNPFAITSSGWYTFQHHFQDDGGTLRVDMMILDSGGNILNTWTINSGDPVGPDCCSPAYDWFPTQEFDFLALDNVSLTQDASAAPVPEPATMTLIGAGLLGMLRRRKVR